MTRPIDMLALVLAAAGAAGCGSDADIGGLYEVTYHTRSDRNCAVEGDDVDDPPYFQLTLEEFLVEYYAYGECESADPTSCSGGFLFFGLTFSEPIDDGWRGEFTASSHGGDQCSLTYSESSAILQGEAGLRIEIRAWGEDITATEEECTPEAAGARGDDMPCANFEVIEGERVDAS